MIIKCSQCSNEKLLRIYLKDYAYKLKDKAGKMHYFCSYNCMRKAQIEHPEMWEKRRD